jgi:murein DD-endopeptidase MepM/ murein hydrolase activator NlpD
VYDPTDIPQQPAPNRLRSQRLLAVGIAVLGVFVTMAIISAVGRSDDAPGIPPVGVQAAAIGVQIAGAGTDAQAAVARPVTGGDPAAQEQVARWSWPSPEPIVDVARIETAASTDDARNHATASAGVATVTMLNGRVVLRNAKLSATASVRDDRAGGKASASGAWRLTIDGVRKTVRPGRVFTIPQVGTLSVNEQAIVANAPQGDAQTGPRFRIVGAIAHLRLTAAVGTVPSGTEIIVGRVDASVRTGQVDRERHPGGTVADDQPSASPQLPAGLQSGSPRPGDSDIPRRSVPVRAESGEASGSLTGYTFPVLGSASFGNDWGAPRASTGVPHQGTDIFAAEGTPIVAIADGVLDRVGWNQIGGYRFWLFDQFGNSFYHAHLSAFSPLARDGAFVRKGDVIGFVGHTGDAQFTPPHVHFEIHPGNGDAVNPYPYLGQWQKGIATTIGNGSFAVGTSVVGGSTLTGFADISPNSGLQPDVLSQVPDGTRPVAEETKPQDTAKALESAIDGSGISAD